MSNKERLYRLLLIIPFVFISACGNDDAQQAQTAPAPESAVTTPVDTVPTTSEPEAVTPVEVPVAVEPAAEAAAPVVEPVPSTLAEPVTAPAPSAPVDSAPIAESPMPEAPAAATPASSEPVDGGQIYNTYCAICHRAGMNAAPKFGSKPLWAKRIAQGRETVYAHAINGLRGMPPRGGFANLTDEQVKAGVDYMVSASGGWGK